jgi:protein TonB
MQAPAAEHHVAQESAQTAPPSPPATPTNATPMPAPAPAVAASSPEAAGSAARVIAQPLPVLPDELREDAFQAVAVARFDIHPDGTIDVQLVKSTPNPRLNQLLLEALHRWRFFPAMQGGRPVESSQDLRVHFNVE